ncbi:hypothetical protein [Desulfofalx alkaliphila]|uniref:hypothetical protein n=1 Tax=Desulfofalx alkaliphila TaxID=105483 RepID=UPI0004E104EE|nr:hypothetical protein [Desulfofalx alkaliphila]
MGAKFKACIKKIEIYNKIMAGSGEQCIKVTLGDIDLTNENLIELRKYKPDRPVEVAIMGAEEEEIFSLVEDQEEPPEASVIKMFNF